jgi:hypothetical protein
VLAFLFSQTGFVAGLHLPHPGFLKADENSRKEDRL